MGNTTAVTDTSGTATLTWDGEDKLASYSKTGTTGATTYLYDADGNQLIRRNPGKTTISLGGDELTYDTTTKTLTGTRSYQIPAGLTLVRQGGKSTYQVNDHHGTGNLSLDATTLTATRRPADPFGNPRGTQPAPGTWAGSKGFVGGTKDDTTGLTNLGARQYQPTTGRFLNPDPVLDPASPQQWNGYAYSNNDPVNLSDPSGLRPDGLDGGFSSTMHDGLTETWTPDGNGGWDWGRTVHLGGIGVGTYTDHQKINFNTRKKKVPYSNLSWKKFVPSALGKAFSDTIGATDAIDCADGSKAACASTAASLIPGEKILSILKNGTKALIEAKRAKKAEESVAAAKKAEKEAEEAKRAEGAQGGSCPTGEEISHSFLAGTEVLLADGTTKPIEKIEVDDKVITTDPSSGQQTVGTVTAKIVTPNDHDFTDLTLKSAESPQEKALTSTQHHPFWDVAANRWVQAGDLHPGDRLLLPDGTTALLTHTANRQTQPTIAYDLTVATTHTYYVLAGETPVLVHNATPSQKCDLTLGAGPNARAGVALVNGNIEADGVRELINEFGNTYGCHTCPATTPGTKYGDWIPDHQPPTSLVPPGSPQTAYPHCWTCARIQAGVASQLSQARSKKAW
ncbi:polymorphic toxin-type HINT domain-containing protein [Kitasatospora fiedleri]|uniref:polymorphic toxin-type HINT domain-containing protein n=1 Tax=Kitasatospora fiedleri TaxID=2991545 RepID=UPI00249B065A|nr:polymorphic toxin-type HINT domain-containing protein [Kitasatospora fiedleri]